MRLCRSAHRRLAEGCGIEGGAREAVIAGSYAYGTAATLAAQLELRDDQRMLHDSLEEERKFDAALTKLAKGEVNRDALAA